MELINVITSENLTVTNPSPNQSPPNVSSAVKYAVITSCILSIFSSAFIIITYLLWKEIRTTSRKLVVYLSVANLFLSMGYGYGAVRDYSESGHDLDCIVQSVITTFSQTSSFVWTISVSIFLYITIVKDDIRGAENSLKYFHIAAWAGPAPLIAAATAFGRLGNDHSYTTVGWCWIKLPRVVQTWNGQEIFWMFFTEKLWEFLAYIILPTLCVMIRRKIRFKCSEPYRYQQHHGDIIAMKQIDQKLLWIPLTFIFLRMWSTARFIMAITDPSLSAVRDQRLMMMQGVCSSGQGIVNFILFCICTRKVRRKMYKCLCYSSLWKETVPTHHKKKLQPKFTERTSLSPNGSSSSLSYSGSSASSSSSIAYSISEDDK